MLNIYIITPFPNLVEPILSESILHKASYKGIVKYNIINLFNFTNNNTDRIDDYPYGGGEGMIIKAEPILKSLNSISYDNNTRIIFPTPDGKRFNHDMAFELSKKKSIIFICGHYKGIDQRIRDKFVTDEISIGDYVLTSGELPSLLIIDSLIRLIPGVLGNYKSAKEDSFFNDLLDGPQYTRPRKVENLEVPKVLLSGNHEKIKEWFLEERIKKTKIRRLDLWEKYKSKINDGE